MKFNRKNPLHWTILIISTINTIGVSLIRPISKYKQKDKIIILSGHKLNGNLKVFFDFLNKQQGFKAYFLTLDKEYYNNLKTTFPDRILFAPYITNMFVVGRSDAFVTSHGLYFPFLLYMTNIKFIDVYHAVSYKGYIKENFSGIHKYDESWVSSTHIKKLYCSEYGFLPSQVKVTGYGRTDILINKSLSKKEILEKYSIPKAKKFILIAPTWKQEDPNREIIPFNIEKMKFFKDLNKLAQKKSAIIIFRAHLNSGNEINVTGLTNTIFMPYINFDVLEDFLLLSDILITDWSSTGIDYLPLKRPTIFLDVPVPFGYGFQLGPEHRFGEVVKNFNELKISLEKYLSRPDLFLKEHGKNVEETTKVAYGNSLDGKSTERYFKNLQRVLDR